MNKQYSADKILANGRIYWPDANHTIECLAIYLHRSAQLLLKHATQSIQQHRINTSEFDVLAALRNSPPPHVSTPTELQRSMLITSGGLTKLLYQLEAGGLISRSVQERDKRSKLVHLTNAGKDLVEKSMGELHETDSEMLDAALSKKELNQLVALLGKVTRTLEHRDGQFTDE